MEALFWFGLLGVLLFAAWFILAVIVFVLWSVIVSEANNQTRD